MWDGSDCDTECSSACPLHFVSYILNNLLFETEPLNSVLLGLVSDLLENSGC